MSVSTVPAVIDALVALCQAALPGVQVCDGQPIAPQREFLAVGFTGEPGEPVVEVTLTQEQATIDPDHEAYEVTCYAYTLRGDTNMKRARDRVYQMVGAVAGRITEDPTLDGRAARARLSTGSLTEQQTPDGAEASLRFVVAVDAWSR